MLSLKKKRRVVIMMELKLGDKVIVVVNKDEADLCVLTLKYKAGYWRCVPVTSTGKLRPNKAMVISEVELIPV